MTGIPLPFIGALDARSWTGLVFSDAPGRGLALRLCVERDGERADGDDFHDLVQTVGPHAPDGSYARVGFDTGLPFGRRKETPLPAPPGEPAGLDLEWSRIEERTVVIRACVRFGGTLELRGYFPWDWKGTWIAGEGELTGITGDGRAALAVAVVSSTAEGHVDGEEGVLRLDVQPGGVLDVFAVFDTEPEAARDGARRISRELNVDEVLGHASRRYDRTRVRVEGHWEGLASTITNNLHWTVALQPERGRLYTPAGRSWIFPAPGGEREHWTLFCWDSFFNALELAVEHPEAGASALAAVLESQYANGNVPNWRGRFAGTPDRSQPPVGSFAVLKFFLRTGQREVLEHAFPYLERWSSWWRGDKKGRGRRGGNHDGLFTWGTDVESIIDSPAPWENEADHRQRAAWESGQDDLPNWDDAGWNDETETFLLDAVDLNSYLALDLECLAHIAGELGEADKAGAYRSLHQGLVRRVNDVLWNSDLGWYADRFRDGRFSPRLAASHLLPLTAGIPPRERAERMLTSLQDRDRFWGEHVIPTVSRDDPAYPDQQYWRGSIWPPMNYLIYAGLYRYRFDETAAELATRSVDLVLSSWRQSGSCWENYDSRSGRGGGNRHQSWGPLLALIGMEEFIDVTPWDGLRIGTLGPPASSTLKRARVADHRWDIELSPEGMKVALDERHLLDTTGPVVLRRVEWNRNRVTVEVLCRKSVRLCFSLDGSRRDRLGIEIEGELFRSVSNVVVVPAGSHVLRVSRVG